MSFRERFIFVILPFSGSKKNLLFPDPYREYRTSPLDPMSASLALILRMTLFGGMSSGNNAVYVTCGQKTENMGGTIVADYTVFV